MTAIVDTIWSADVAEAAAVRALACAGYAWATFRRGGDPWWLSTATRLSLLTSEWLTACDYAPDRDAASTARTRELWDRLQSLGVGLS